MARKLFILLPFIFFIPTVMPSPPRTPSISGKKSIDLIEKYCKDTIYPKFCYTSLAKHANLNHPTPIQLLQLASNLTVNRLRGLSHRVSMHAAGQGQEATALRDCEKALRAAVDKARQSTRELAGLKGEGYLEVEARATRVQSWMGMALANMDGCYDNLHKVSSEQVKADMSRRIQQIKRFASNALSLVNSLITDLH